MDKLSFGVQALEFFTTRNIKVFIHCKNGHGRAPTLYVAYLLKTGMAMDAAIASLKAKRPAVHFTDAQKEALRDFTTSLNQHYE